MTLPDLAPCQFVAMSDKGKALLLDQQRRDAIDWISKHWASLPEDVRAEIGDAARKARRAAP